MNDESEDSTWQRSTTRRPLAWLTSRRGIRRILISCAWVATLIALFYAEENWRGRRAWNKYRQQLEARGAHTELKALLPKPVPDDLNFAATPVVQSWFAKKTYAETDQRWNDDYARVAGKLSSVKAGADKPQKGVRQFTDLAAWAAALDGVRTDKTNLTESASGKLDAPSGSSAAPAVLEGLKSSEMILSELRAASSRPNAVYPVDYTLEDPWAILLPHLANVKAACQRFQLKASAELAIGDGARAFEDVKMIFYMADSLKEEPFLIAYLVRLACVHIAIQPIWEGLAAQQWSEPQLQELQTRLQRYDFIADMKRPLEAEHAAGILTADLIRQKGAGYLFALGAPESGGSSPRSAAGFMMRLIPRGWYYHEKVNYSRVFQMQQQTLTAAGSKARVLPSRVKKGMRNLDDELAGSAGANRRLAAVLNHHVVAALLLPALGRVSVRAASAQTAVEHAAIACALERHRLAKGNYPDNPDALVPQFIAELPPDPITGEPYQYRRAEAGRFILYSIGWNEKDDSGMPGKNLFDEKDGDWVWQYPAPFKS
jgi:hypothetical protein